MDNFSIDVAAEQIVDARSRDYFQEVLSSFTNGNFRSAVVMLWSVVVADIVYKLQTLRDLYQDPTAKTILETTEKKQQQNPTNPEWEIALLDDVAQKTKLLESADYQNLAHLQKLRHLSAHPVLSSANILFAPNKETTRACIRNALEGLFLKPPMFSKNIISEFVKDISEKKALLPDLKDLKQYVDAKYFVNLHSSIEKELIKTLWKFCFRLSNADTDANREINTRCLQLLYQRNPVEFKNTVVQSADYFSEVAPNGPPLYSLTYFLSDRPALYGALKDTAKVPLQNFVLTDGNLLVAASFVSSTFDEHLTKICGLPYQARRDINSDVWARLVTKGKEEGALQKVLTIGACIYTESGSFDSADVTFARFVEPYLSVFDSATLTTLLSGVEKNNQTYWRGRSSVDHAKVNERAVALGVDTSPFDNFVHSVKK